MCAVQAAGEGEERRGGPRRGFEAEGLAAALGGRQAV